MTDHERTHDVRSLVIAVPATHRRPIRVQRRLFGRALGIDDRLEQLVLDSNLLRRPTRLLGMLGRDERDRLAEVAHAVDREHRLVAELEPVELLAGDVVVREHRVHAGHRQRARRVDPDDARVRLRAADRVAPEHPRRVQVARVRELARDLRDGVGPADDLADATDLQLTHRLRHARAAARTASKIFA